VLLTAVLSTTFVGICRIYECQSCKSTVLVSNVDDTRCKVIFGNFEEKTRKLAKKSSGGAWSSERMCGDFLV